MKYTKKVVFCLLLILTASRSAYSQKPLSVNYNTLNTATPIKVKVDPSAVGKLEILSPGTDPSNIVIKYNLVGGAEAPYLTANVAKDKTVNAQSITLTDFPSFYKTNSTLENIIVYDGGTLKGKIQFEQVVAKGDQPSQPLLSANSYDQWARNQYPILNRQVALNKWQYDNKLNQIRNGNTIHVFLDEQGNMIRSSLPTTAAENNFYTFHIVYKIEAAKDKRFKMEYSGDYAPLFEVYGSSSSKSNEENAGKSSTGDDNSYAEQVFGPIGPFTSNFTVKIFNSATPADILINKTVSVAKLHYIAMNAGLYGSFLRNPEGIKVGQRSNGDTTLFANDPATRGIITIMLTFYPRPRNLMFPLSKDWKDKVGFTVGTGISKKLAENFFAGVSYDVARGLSVVGGVHYGRTSVVIDDEFFKFGLDKFSGALGERVVKKWDANFFIGLNLDFRLLGLIFSNSTP